ncbi:RanBP1 domain protein [Dictyocaulus viviparus]|uniref:RanBP1 domain protein n=1 Tax=Dictyocaulus viviparus TaxID=29172 RepID=A0A0D8XFP9_DICVI|nr:RanBP1 domain protein [Dictyocaulus viviparus]
MARIVANVVDMQQQLVSQYQTVVTALEALKVEVHNSNRSIRDDLKRTDDRAQKQVDDLRTTHANEVERLMDLIKTLLTRDGKSSSEPPRVASSQMAYTNAGPPNVFFGAPGNPLNDFAAQAQAHYAACYLQQLQDQQRARSGCLAGGGIFGNQQGLMGNVALSGTFPQSQQNPPTYACAPKLSNDTSVVPPAPVAVSTLSSNNPLSSCADPHVANSTFVSTTNHPPTSFIATPASAITPMSLPVSTQPKIEIGKVNYTGKSDIVSSKPPFTFATPKSETPNSTPVSLESTKPASIFSEIKSTHNIFNKTPEMKSINKHESGDGPEDGEHDNLEEFEPQIDFKPVCPLPELVKIVTGEENEKVLFEENCKLYRYADDTNEWKERGTGIMKVLEDVTNRKCRIVMRRAQVHKVCANHQLLPGMTIQAMPRQEKAMMWYCEDFSEEQKSHEKLSARFASVEVANKFKEIFENAVKIAEDSNGKTFDKALVESVELSNKDGMSKEKKNDFKGFEGKSEVIVASDNEKCSAREQKGYGEQFKLQPGQWECPGCYARNTSEKCPCCGASKNAGKTGVSATKSVLPASTIPLGVVATESNTPKFTFGLSAAAAAKDSPATSASAVTNSPLFGASLMSTSTPSNTLSFSSKHSVFGGATGKPTTAGSLNSSSNTGGSVFGGCRLFGTSKTNDDKKDTEKKEKSTPEQAKSEQKIFGSGFGGGNISFTSSVKSASGSIFDSAHTQKAQAEFAAQAKSKLTITDKKEKINASSTQNKGDGGEQEAERGADEDYEPDVDFAPVIPLPDLVEVVTGEEGEQVVFTARAKLFRFIKETKENKERGVGELKILRNPKNNAYRVVMRRDQVHKVCANFAISPSIELNEKKGAQHAYNWICRDYSESREGTDEIFTVKFKTAEIAKEFHDKFVEAAAAHVVVSK